MQTSTPNTDLIVALDFPRPEPALQMVETLEGLDVIFKVGLELFLSAGPQLVRELVHQQKRVFLDLKFHDIPNTVAKASLQAALLKVEMLTVHLVGGSAMIQAIKAELGEIPALRPKILGVSVLTSFDDVRWAEVTRALTHHAMDVHESVSGLVLEGVRWGADGVVCSAMELDALLRIQPDLYTVVPGIRPAGSGAGDQARVMTPAQARQAGACAIVMGRPIIESRDPRALVESVMKDLSAMRISA